MMYPQAYLLHRVAFSTPKSGLVEKSKPLPFFDPTLKISRFGLQKLTTLAKLKGAYFPEAIISAIFNTKIDPVTVSKFFLNIENHKLSSLTPEVRLYKLDEEDGTVKPFYFPIVSDYKFVGEGNMMDLSSSYTSNAAVIERFAVTYTGKNPFQADRSFLDADLTIKLDNVSIMFDTPSDDYAPLADLFTIRSPQASRTAGSNKASPGNALENGKNCKVIATMGYSTPLNSLFSSKEKKVLKNMFQTIGLHYSSHDLQIAQDGSASLSVKYNGYLEALKGESQFDLVSNIEAKTRLIKAKVGSTEKKEHVSLESFMSRRKKADPTQEEKAKTTTEQEIAVPTVGDIMSAFGEIIDQLFNNDKIHIADPWDASNRRFITLSNGKEDLVNLQGLDESAGFVQSLVSDKGVNSFRPTQKQIEYSEMSPFELSYGKHMCYLAFGDIIDAYYSKVQSDLNRMLKSIMGDKDISDETKSKLTKRIAILLGELKRLNVLMADVIYTVKDPSATDLDERIVNIADIPIALDTFYTTVFEEIVESRISFYDMNNFITSFVPKLLTRSFGELPMADIVNPIIFTITSYMSKPLDASNIAEYNINIDDVPSPLMMTSKTRSENLDQYIIIHQEPSRHTRTLGSGEEEDDLRNGIFHLRANQNSGVIKNITFQKIASPAREAYMVYRNADAYDEIRFAHNANVEMVGNNLLYPMTSVYVNPESLGFGDPRGPNSAARKLGFGGYYTVGDVETKFENGTLETRATLYFNSFPDVNNQQKSFGRKKKKKLKDTK